MAHLGPDNGSGERQAGLVVGGEGGLGEQSARVGGVAVALRRAHKELKTGTYS